jgi:alpha-D-ribose 1-methylphosphonate 5-triphosphate synthase subunit PhnH
MIDEVWRPENQQQIFRALLSAMARPGEVFSLGPALGGAAAYLAILATLVDGRAPYADPHELLDPRARRLLEAPRVEGAEAGFVVVHGKADPSALSVRLGDLDAPEEGATLVVVVERIAESGGCSELTMDWRGPGIPASVIVGVDGLDPRWLESRAQWNRHFPMGVDMFVADGRRVAGLPRTTRVERRA